MSNFLATTEEAKKNFGKFSKIVDPMKFFLYRRGHNSPIVIGKNNASEQIDVGISTYIIIHGWSSSGTQPWIKELAKNLHQVKNFNIIAADWSILASSSYFKAVKKIKNIGYHIEDFIKTLKVSIGTIQIFGHSLGAEIAAYVGRGLGTLGGQKVEQIIGCDPAGLFFDWPLRLLSRSRLTAYDGQFVQIIHTGMLLVGTTTPLGTIDFYVNKGMFQPGCPKVNKGTKVLFLYHQVLDQEVALFDQK